MGNHIDRPSEEQESPALLAARAQSSRLLSILLGSLQPIDWTKPRPLQDPSRERRQVSQPLADDCFQHGRVEPPIFMHRDVAEAGHAPHAVGEFAVEDAGSLEQREASA